MGEPFTWTTAIGLAAILLGVAATHQSNSFKASWPALKSGIQTRPV
jgi:hypothetical protein